MTFCNLPSVWQIYYFSALSKWIYGDYRLIIGSDKILRKILLLHIYITTDISSYRSKKEYVEMVYIYNHPGGGAGAYAKIIKMSWDKILNELYYNFLLLNSVLKKKMFKCFMPFIFMKMSEHWLRNVKRICSKIVFISSP